MTSANDDGSAAAGGAIDSPHVMQQLERSRKKPRVGDIFVIKVMDRYLFGRVIATDARWTTEATAPTVNLIYVYRCLFEEPSPMHAAGLRPDGLLFPPVITNNLGWARGYFKTIGSGSISSADRLPNHVFKDSYGEYYDEFGNLCKPPSSPQVPVGSYGLASFLSIDSRIEKSLGER